MTANAGGGHSDTGRDEKCSASERRTLAETTRLARIDLDIDKRVLVGVIAGVFLRAGVQVDRIAGTSMGALIGANAAMGRSPDEIYEVFERTSGLRVFFDLCDEEDDMLVRSFHDADADHMPVTQPGRYRAVAEIPADLLAPRDYHLRLRATLFHIRHLTGDGAGRILSIFNGEERLAVGAVEQV